MSNTPEFQTVLLKGGSFRVFGDGHVEVEVRGFADLLSTSIWVPVTETWLINRVKLKLADNTMSRRLARMGS